MNRNIFWGVIGSAGLFFSGEEAVMNGEAGHPPPPQKFGIEFTTDKPAYTPKEKIQMTLKIVGSFSTPFTFQFPSGQRYDFVIENEKGEEVWRWSRDKMFIQMLGEEKVGGPRKSLTYREVFQGQLPTGRYRITGHLTSSNAPLSSTLTFFVNPKGKQKEMNPVPPLH